MAEGEGIVGEEIVEGTDQIEMEAASKEAGMGLVQNLGSALQNLEERDDNAQPFASHQDAEITKPGEEAKSQIDAGLTTSSPGNTELFTLSCLP